MILWQTRKRLRRQEESELLFIFALKEVREGRKSHFWPDDNIIMATDHHRKIENCLVTLGAEWKSQRRIRKVYRGSEHPLSIVDPRSKRVVNYQPDVYFILRNNRKLIFEILDSEAEKQDIIIADVIRSFLVENVDGLFFIHPGPETVETRIFEALITIYKGLVRKGVDESELPNRKKTGPLLVPTSEVNIAQELKNKLTQYADEGKWFKSLQPLKSKAV
ncbi:MAG: hypothetical protein HXY36_05475 [Chloroflexi bacterium]|nr:hypothetical protein [Chloroflexota bacterium]